MSIALSQVSIPDFGPVAPPPILPASTYAARCDAALGPTGWPFILTANTLPMSCS
jgi:hypothetical protein